MNNEFVAWFLENKRDLPWRTSRTPYRVWISEVMLQQTQVDRVIPFFTSWMDTLPSIHSLAESQEQTVMKLWEGLGYYSRARALIQGARVIQRDFNGTIPSTEEELLSIPSIGPYTQGAIRSFAFRQKAAAVDANVLRVISRLYDLPIEVGKANSLKEVVRIVESILPASKPYVMMEALIELGALLCQKNAQCHRCPLKSTCLSFLRGTVSIRPIARKPSARIREERIVCLFQKGEYVCVVHRTGKAVMSGLWEFPYVPYEEPFLQTWKPHIRHSFSPVNHSYTTYYVTLYPYLIEVPSTFVWPDGTWMKRSDLLSLPFSSGHKRVLHQLISLM